MDKYHHRLLYCHYDSIVGNTILWNGAPVSFLEPTHSFTQDNGQLWSEGSVYYQNIPLPTLKGTRDISSSTSNTLYLPSETTVWRITFDDSLSNHSWTLVDEGPFLNGYSRVSIHKRLLPPGAYIIDNTNMLFLFNETEDDLITEYAEEGME